MLSEPTLSPSERRAFWLEAVMLSISLSTRQLKENWITVSAVTIVALIISPFWMLVLLPLFLIKRTKVE